MVICTKFVTDNDNIIVMRARVCARCVYERFQRKNNECKKTLAITKNMCNIFMQQIKTVLARILGWLQVSYI